MEKVIAVLWATDGEDREQFGQRLLSTLPDALTKAGARSVRLNIRDAAVVAGEDLVHSWQSPQQAAVAQFWMPSTNALFRGEVDAALGSHSARFAAWLVTESTIIANPDPTQNGAPARTRGWSQASFIRFRSDITRAAAIAHWHSHHTRIAIDTQSNFEYVQNLIVKPLTKDAPAYDAFVEECFPIEALTQAEVFYDGVGDPDKFAANTAAMMESCTAFLDFTRIDVFPTSQFDFA